MPHPILNEDWSEYDNRKIRDGRDKSKVSCEETWEINYIVTKLRRHFPDKADMAIKAAMSECCQSIKAPRPRVVLMECVTKRLSS